MLVFLNRERQHFTHSVGVVEIFLHPRKRFESSLLLVLHSSLSQFRYSFLQIIHDYYAVHYYSLYPTCSWEDKAVRKLIGDGKIAARLRGTENRASPTDRECPICFLQYPQVNVTKCCSAHLCTECYLQVRPQKAKSPSCPFCNHTKFSVGVAQTMNAEAMLAREENEQRVIEAKIRDRTAQKNNSDNYNSNNNSKNGMPGSDTGGSEHGSASGFGSSLEQHERIASLRARSSSISEHDNIDSIPEDVLKASFAMTPEERRQLEDEMRAQHSHPLSLRLQAEAEERRLRNEQEFLRNNPTYLLDAANVAARAASRSGGGSRRGRGTQRNWNQIVEAFERGGHGEVNSLDDLVVLEAAMILSMEEESRRRGGNSNSNAASANNNETDEAFDVNRHATEGFPLVRTILSGRQQGTGAAYGGEVEDANEQLQSLANSLYSRRRGRNSLLRSASATENNSLDTALETAGLLMRGISEDDQLAMAIAASLQDQQQPEQQQEQAQQNEEGQGSDANNDGDDDEGDGDGVADGSNADDGDAQEAPGDINAASDTSGNDQVVEDTGAAAQEPEDESGAEAQAENEGATENEEETDSDAVAVSENGNTSAGASAGASDGLSPGAPSAEAAHTNAASESSEAEHQENENA